MNLDDIFNIVVEFGANNGIPYILVNDNNVLEILTDSQVISYVYTIRDLLGLFLIFSTLISVLNNIHDIVNGRFKISSDGDNI